MSKRKTSADGTILRACFSASFERAASQDGRFRIRGVANTFGVMRSGRMFHPNAFDKWLAANAQPNLALLGNHGMDVAGFASIGRVDGARVSKQGLVFDAWIGEATQLARDARALVEEGTLKGISVGWMARGMSRVHIDDPKLDPALAEALRAAEAHSADVTTRADLVEISLVDVADDAGATLAARSGASGDVDRAAFDTLRSEVAELTRMMRSWYDAEQYQLYLSTGRIPDGGCCGSFGAYRGGEHDGSPPRDVAEAERRAFPNGRDEPSGEELAAFDSEIESWGDDDDDPLGSVEDRGRAAAAGDDDRLAALRELRAQLG